MGRFERALTYAAVCFSLAACGAEKPLVPSYISGNDLGTLPPSEPATPAAGPTITSTYAPIHRCYGVHGTPMPPGWFTSNSVKNDLTKGGFEYGQKVTHSDGTVGDLTKQIDSPVDPNGTYCGFTVQSVRR